jgi:predicted metal-dependent peptidase
MSVPDLTLAEVISATRLRLRRHSPYFATLAMYAQVVADASIPVAATDGMKIYLNAEKFCAYSADYREAIFLHEVLHAALLHIPRRGRRQPLLWNIAADIVVNAMVDQSGLSLPRGAVREPQLEHLPVEEIYELLRDDDRTIELPGRLVDLRPGLGPSADGEAGGGNGDGDGRGGGEDSELELARIERARAHWKRATGQAKTVARATGQGSLPAGFDREFGQVGDPELDWRRLLWQHLARTPSDFGGFDRRLVSRGLYLETLDGRSLNVYIAVDTSGSIDRQQMTDFLSEVQGILRAYPHVEVELYYADADIYGPFELTAAGAIPEPKGGGGTDFRPFFEAIADRHTGMDPTIAVYLTDGYGDFPRKPPRVPVVWAISPGGLASEEFPFGKKMRLVGSDRA